MTSRMRATVCSGLLMILASGHFLAAAAARGLKSTDSTFPTQPPSVLIMQPLTAPRPNLQLPAAPMPMGVSITAAPMPPWQPAPLAQSGPQHMRLAAPAAPATPATQASTAAAAAVIPYAPAIPYNPNSLYKPLPQQATQVQAGTSTAGPIPESHPVGLLPPTAPIPARPRGIAALISTGAQALSTLAKHVLQQSSTEPADEAQQDVLGAQEPSSQDRSPVQTGALWGSSMQQFGQQAYEEVEAAAGTAGPFSAADYKPMQAAASNNNMQQQGQRPAAVPAPVGSVGQLGQASVGVAAVPAAGTTAGAASMPWSTSQQQLQWPASSAVVAVAKPGGAAAGAAAVQPAAAGAAGVMSASSRSRVAGPTLAQQSLPAVTVPAATAGNAGGAAGGGSSQMPWALGVASLATNNMGAPMAGSLGGPTYMLQPQAATAAAAPASPAKVSPAVIGSFSSYPAAGPPPSLSSSLGSVQQHFAGSKPPQYAPLSPTLHVSAPAGSKARGKSIGPSIDDVSAAAGAPVAQVTWQLPKKVHVAFAPAAELLRAAPVSPFELPSSMRADDDGVQGSKGAVTHTLTPTWVPAA